MKAGICIRIGVFALRLDGNGPGLKEVATIRTKVAMKNGSNIPALTGLKGDAPAISFKPLLSAAASTNFNRSTRKKKNFSEGNSFNH